MQTPDESDNSAAVQSGDEINAGLIAAIGLFAAVVFFLIFILLQAWFYSWKADVAVARTLLADDPRTPLGQMTIEQQQQLESYRWIDREKKLRAIPIQQAMEIVAREMSAAQKKSQSETSLETSK
jgi:hypothetical protein